MTSIYFCLLSPISCRPKCKRNSNGNSPPYYPYYLRFPSLLLAYLIEFTLAIPNKRYKNTVSSFIIFPNSVYNTVEDLHNWYTAWQASSELWEMNMLHSVFSLQLFYLRHVLPAVLVLSKLNLKPHCLYFYDTYHSFDGRDVISPEKMSISVVRLTQNETQIVF